MADDKPNEVVESWPVWFIKMMQTILEMRDAQRDYFSAPNDYKLRVSKAKEKTVDDHLEQFIRLKVIAHQEKQIQSNQPKLFQ
jgi:hypothetical protein